MHPAKRVHRRGSNNTLSGAIQERRSAARSVSADWPLFWTDGDRGKERSVKNTWKVFVMRRRSLGGMLKSRGNKLPRAIRKKYSHFPWSAERRQGLARSRTSTEMHGNDRRYGEHAGRTRRSKRSESNERNAITRKRLIAASIVWKTARL